MSRISLSEDIRSVTELKRNTRAILDHLHATGRPVILTVNGKADSVLLDVHSGVVSPRGKRSPSTNRRSS